MTKFERDFIDPSCVLYLPLWKRGGSSFPSDDRYGSLVTVVGGAEKTPKGRIFDNSDDHLTLPAAGPYNLTSEDISIIVWLKCHSQSGWRKPFASGAYETAGFCMQIDPSSELMFLTNQSSAAQTTMTNYSPIATNEWVCAGARRVGAVVDLFSNGVEVTGYGAKVSHTAPASSGSIATIGVDTDQSSNRFDGEIGLILILARALSDLEFQRFFLDSKSIFK